MRQRADKLDLILGARLKELRKRKGISQSALGFPLGLSFQQVQKYEKGTNHITVPTLIRLCKVLDSDPVPIVAELARHA
jgi:transcriptional regulator with XRE-family HTH domain